MGPALPFPYLWMTSLTCEPQVIIQGLLTKNNYRKMCNTKIVEVIIRKLDITWWLYPYLSPTYSGWNCNDHERPYSQYLHHVNWKNMPKIVHFQISLRYVSVGLINLWSSDAIWRHRSGSILAQVMACCLMAPSHYLNQWWLVISKVQWDSPESNFTRNISVINH